MSVAVIGNPKVHSRTRHAAELVIAAMTGSPPDSVIELSELGRACSAGEIRRGRGEADGSRRR